MRRSRRNLLERLLYAQAFRCKQCGKRVLTSQWNWKFARYVKCPRCHSVDLTALRRRDGIDRMQPGLINLFHKLAGGKLYHCWFCRLQFYDLRRRFNVNRNAGHTQDRDSAASEQDLRIA